MKTRNQAAGGFTLLEVILAVMIVGLIAGAVYAMTTASLEASRAVMDEQSSVRRLEAFLGVLRDAFLRVPADGEMYLEMTESAGGAPVPVIHFVGSPGVFGVSSLGGGSLLLSARPAPDGTRTFSMLRLPAGLSGIEQDRLMDDGAWVPLLAGVERVEWLFYQNGEWVAEWPQGLGRPLAVGASFEYEGVPGLTINAQFRVPPLSRAPTAPSGEGGGPGEGNVEIEVPEEGGEGG
jgi:prepilin-type N-terminal cleavage/methylation domain-containing protein